MTDSFYSVGIDIGTTTTHLVVSLLHLDNSSRVHEAPRLRISKKEIAYTSPVCFTPLTSEGNIDADKVKSLVEQHYSNAGIAPSNVSAGALIITGESARKRNAEEVAHSLSEYAGDFVVASAGPNLESILAARGSGAIDRSRETGKTICNVDIGGGTTNCVVIENGHIIDNACFGIGGRCLQFDRNARLLHVTDSAKWLLPDSVLRDCETAEFWAEINTNQKTIYKVRNIADTIADAIVEFLQGVFCRDARLLHSSSPLGNHYIDEYWITGGVGSLMMPSFDAATPSGITYECVFPYNDMGKLLADSLRHRFEMHNLTYVVPPDSIRATVIGAGMHVVQLTGSTVSVDESVLPLKNIPVIRFEFDSDELRIDPDKQFDAFETAVVRQLRFHDLDWRMEPIALHLEGLKSCSFGLANQLAGRIIDLVSRCDASEPFVFSTSSDVAAAIGLLLKKRLRSAKILVIDGIDAGDGDFIDIGKPFKQTRQGLSSLALPVIIKSLVFLD